MKTIPKFFMNPPKSKFYLFWPRVLDFYTDPLLLHRTFLKFSLFKKKLVFNYHLYLTSTFSRKKYLVNKNRRLWIVTMEITPPSYP